MAKAAPKIIFSDFDGTLTLGESLTPQIFEVLNLVERLGAELVIVTGRSLSWAHFLLTHFPLNAVISEGGGMMTLKRGFEMVDVPMISADQERTLEQIAEELPRCFLNVHLTADSFGRRADRAIDLHLLGDAKVRRGVEEYLAREGASFSSSSVHLNFWVGEFSKATTSLEYLQCHHPLVGVEQCLFFGDGLNDQSMFAAFPHSVGVSNIAPIVARLSPPPKVVLKGESQAGPLGVVHYLKQLLS